MAGTAPHQKAEILPTDLPPTNWSIMTGVCPIKRETGCFFLAIAFPCLGNRLRSGASSPDLYVCRRQRGSFWGSLHPQRPELFEINGGVESLTLYARWEEARNVSQHQPVALLAEIPGGKRMSLLPTSNLPLHG